MAAVIVVGVYGRIAHPFQPGTDGMITSISFWWLWGRLALLLRERQPTSSFWQRLSE